MGRIPFPIGTCIDCGSKDKKLITKRCFDEPNFCYTKYQKAKYEAKQAGKEPKKKTAIAKVSSKQAKLNHAYLILRQQFLKDYPECRVKSEKCRGVSSQIHHKRGRIGSRMLDTTEWLETCAQCHEKIETSPEWAYQNGYSLKRL